MIESNKNKIRKTRKRKDRRSGERRRMNNWVMIGLDGCRRVGRGALAIDHIFTCELS